MGPKPVLLFMVLLGIFLGMGLPPLGEVERVEAYRYGPACQWIHLVGEVVLPEDRKVKGPIELTVTYQLPGMENPATLLTNFPLPKDKFKFFLAGFDQELDGVFLVSPMFFFAKEIVFRYFAKSADRKYITGFQKSTFYPPHIPVLDIPKTEGKIYRCHTGLALQPLVLRPRS